VNPFDRKNGTAKHPAPSPFPIIGLVRWRTNMRNLKNIGKKITFVDGDVTDAFRLFH
jgi:hypothetical protein